MYGKIDLYNKYKCESAKKYYFKYLYVIDRVRNWQSPTNGMKNVWLQLIYGITGDDRGGIIGGTCLGLVKFIPSTLFGIFEGIDQARRDPKAAAEMLVFLAKVTYPVPSAFLKEKMLFNIMIIEAAKAYATEFEAADSYEKGIMIGTAIGTILSFFVSGAGIAKTTVYMLDSVNLLRETGAITSILQKAFQGTNAATRLANARKASKLIDLASKALKSITSALKSAPETIFSKVKSVTSNGDQLKLISNTGVEVNTSEAKLISRLKTAEKMTDDAAKTAVKCLKNECFSGDTLVTTKDGLKRIDSIQVGDYVLAKDVNNNIIDYKQVKNVYVKNTFEFFHLKLGDEEIRTTANHLFFTDSGWWKAAKDLNVGDKILNSEGELKALVSTSVEALEEPEKIYNLNVDEYHTYFVGTNGLLVHNNCTSQMIAAGRDAITRARARGITNVDELAAIGNASAKNAGIKFNRYKTLVSPQIASNIEYFEEVGYTQVKLFDKSDNLLAIVEKETYDTARVLQENYLSSRFQSGSANKYLVKFNDNLIIKQSTDNSLSKLVNTARDAFLKENPTETTRNFAALNYKTPQMTNPTTLKSVSGGNNPVGFVNNPEKQRFLTFKANSDGELPLVNQNIPNAYYPRDLDTEYKLLSELDKYIEGNLVNLEKGIAKDDIIMDVNLHTRYEPCPSCLDVMRQFNEKYLNIKINVTWEIPY